MKKNIVLLLCICIVLGLTACGDNSAGGLGQLVIGKDDDTAPTKGGSGIPDLGGNGGSTPTPTPKGQNNPTFPPATPTPTPTPANAATPTPITPDRALTTTRYTDENISMLIPTGWTVNCQAYNSGAGLYRLFCCIYDPQDPTNQIFFCTALEPLFTSEAAKQMFCSVLPEYSFAPVIEALNATAVMKQWSALYKGISMTDVTNPKISKLLMDFTVTGVINEQDGGFVNGGYYTSVLASVQDMGGSPYVVSFTNLLVRNLQTGIEFYQSYANYLCLAKKSVADSYIPVLNECVASLDISGFQKRHGSGFSAGDDTPNEAGYMILPKLKRNYDGLK